MLLVATARPRPDGSACEALSAVRGHLLRVPISGLENEDAERLVEHLLGASSTEAREAVSILESSRGHPMFIEELVRYLARPRTGGGAATLDDAVSARAEDLDPTTRNVLRVIAIAGQPTAQAIIAEAAGLPFPSYAESAAILRAGRLVRARAPAWKTRWSRSTIACARPSARAWSRPCSRRSMAPSARARAARRDPELLYWHFAAAGDSARAVGYAELAADAASRALAFDRAAALYRHALTGRPADSERRRRLLVLLGDPPRCGALEGGCRELPRSVAYRCVGRRRSPQIFCAVRPSSSS